MLSKEWIDFVAYPLDSNRVLTREQRLDVSNAIRVTNENYTPTLGTEKGTVITKDQIIFDLDNDEFEAMEIGITGAVVIWTKKRVWFLLKDRGIEKLTHVPRNPDSDSGFLEAHKIETNGKQ